MSKRTPSEYRVSEFQYQPAYAEKSNPCLMCGILKPRSSSTTTVTHLKDAICHCCGCLGGMWRSRALFRITVSWDAAQYLLLYRKEIEALLDQFGATCTPHLRHFLERNPLYIAQPPMFCLHLISHLTLRATRAPYRSRAGPPSNCGVAVSADVTHDEYERHRACSSVKP